MHKLVNNMSMDDVQQWLRSGWFYAEIGRETRLVRFEHIDERSICVWDPADDEHHNVAPGDITIHWPQGGAINCDGGAVFVNRRQARQWRRAYSSRGVRVTVPNRWGLLGRLPHELCRASGDEWGVVRHLFHPRYPDSLPEAMEMLRGQPTVALNPHIMLIDEKGPIGVYYRGERVGTCNNGVFASTCDHLTARRVTKLIGGVI
jgi:hypothetical protein